VGTAGELEGLAGSSTRRSYRERSEPCTGGSTDARHTHTHSRESRGSGSAGGASRGEGEVDGDDGSR
jgi:hypothetical protein